MKTVVFLLFALILVSASLGGFSPQAQDWVDFDQPWLKSINVLLADGDNLWIGTQDRGLFKTARLSITDTTRYSQGNTTLESDNIKCLAKDGSGNLWVGTAKGVAKFDGTSTWTVYEAELPNGNVQAVGADASGNIWVGTGGGLSKHDGASSWTTYNTGSGLPSDNIRAVTFDAGGNTWVGTWGGGLAGSPNGGTSWMTHETSPSGLQSNNISGISVDGTGCKWIGTDGGLTWFDGVSSWGRELTGKNIQAVAAEGSDVYAGTLMNGLAARIGGAWYEFKEGNTPGMLKNMVSAITVDATSHKWISTRFGGLNAYKAGGHIRHNLNGMLASKGLWCTGRAIHTGSELEFRYFLPNSAGVVLRLVGVNGQTSMVHSVHAQGPGMHHFRSSYKGLAKTICYYELCAGREVVAGKLLLSR